MASRKMLKRILHRAAKANSSPPKECYNIEEDLWPEDDEGWDDD